MHTDPPSSNGLRRRAWGRAAGAIAGALLAGAIAEAMHARPVILYLVAGASVGSALGGWLARRR